MALGCRFARKKHAFNAQKRTDLKQRALTSGCGVRCSGSGCHICGGQPEHSTLNVWEGAAHSGKGVAEGAERLGQLSVLHPAVSAANSLPAFS